MNGPEAILRTARAAGIDVPAARAEDAETMVREIERALAEPGPHLIEAILS